MKRYVKTAELFPLIKEELLQNKCVKFTVSGHSMMPFIRNNRDQVLVQFADMCSLKKRDIILFEAAKDRYTLHRICRKTQKGYITLGDACFTKDDEVAYHNILGKVTKIYRNGKEINCNSLSYRFVVCIWCRFKTLRRIMYMLYRIKSRLKRIVIPR